MNKMIYFDMDGTLNNFYGVENWLESLENEDAMPYREAPCTVDEEVLKNLVKAGFTLGVISWLSKKSSKDFDKKVRLAKREWLKNYYPTIDFEEIHIVKYGTPKYKVAKVKDSILFDDEERNRNAWKGQAFTPDEIKNFLGKFQKNY